MPARFPQFEDRLPGYDEALADLHALGQRARAAGTEAHGQVAFILNGIISFLAAQANVLDTSGKTRLAIPNDVDTWQSVNVVINRAFLGLLHTAVEGGLIDICRRLNIVASSRRAQAIALADRLRRKLKDPGLVASELRKLEKMGSVHPEFHDYLEGALKKTISSDRQKTWRRFFDALSVVRNKVSHSETALTEADIERLNRGGLAAMIIDGELKIAPQSYEQLVRFVLDFFDELLAAVTPTTPAA
jgi:hypothetical protein